jgi:nucleoid DNA-binding protein
MTRKKLVSMVSRNTGITNEDVENVLIDVFKVIKSSVSQDEPVNLRGFGTFKVTLRKSKKVRNIGKGETFIMPERYIPDFVPSKYFKWHVDHFLNPSKK